MKRQTQREEVVVELPQDVWNMVFSWLSNDLRFVCLSVSKNFHSLVLGTFQCLYLVKNYSPKWSASLSRKCHYLQKLSVISCIGPHWEVTNEWIMPLTNLNTLRIPNSTTLTDVALKPLKHLRTLVLENAQHITDESLCNLTNLTHLDLSRNKIITDSAVERLTKLTHLDLSRNLVITNRSVSKLVNLDTLLLNENRNITDSAIRCLSNLTRISLRQNYHISDQCLIDMALERVDYRYWFI